MWWIAIVGCGSPIYAPCDAAADCPAPDGVEAECLDGAEGGFCTWSCTVDEDCVFDQGDWPLVCAPFESEGGDHCFPSCEGADEDAPDACPPGFGCRSTGGGSDNRKICYPA
ncbi:MAG: hypothetical protein ABMB14_07285 [Myxococcota bacterium]